MKKNTEKDNIANEQALNSPSNIYKKSNLLINAKGRANLMSLRLFAVGMNYARFDKSKNAVISTIPVKDIAELIGLKNPYSLYEKVKIATIKDNTGKRQSLLDWQIINESEEDQSFDAINVIQRATYRKGILTIIYNSSLTDQLINLKSNYTLLNLTESLKFQGTYGYQLYEVLKSNLDYIRAISNKGKKGAVDWKIHITNLKLMLGVIDSAKDQQILNAMRGKNSDYDYIQKLAIDKNLDKYPQYKEFNRSLLKKAVSEINENTSLVVTYKGKRVGGATKFIEFIIDDKQKIEESEDINSLDDSLIEKQEEPVMDKTEALMMAATILAELHLTMAGVREISEAANYDVDKIQKAYDILKETPKVKNAVGFMIKAIQDEYSSPVEVENKTKTRGRKKRAGDFEERIYDYEELEEKLFKN